MGEKCLDMTTSVPIHPQMFRFSDAISFQPHVFTLNDSGNKHYIRKEHDSRQSPLTTDGDAGAAVVMIV